MLIFVFILTAIEFYESGLPKLALRDDKGAIQDFSKAIELDSMYAEAYLGSGCAKLNLLDFNGAIAEFSKAIEIDPKYAEAYHNRGLTKIESGQKNRGYQDLNKARELGFSKAYGTIKKFGQMKGH